jgi:hypothetical protein
MDQTLKDDSRSGTMKAQAAASPRVDTETSVRAPLLEMVLQGLDPKRRVFVIDLGGLRAATLRTLSAFRCRLDVIDLDIHAFPVDEAPIEGSFRARVSLFEQGLPELDEEQADLLLCWTYLNYFSLDQLLVLMPALIERLGPSGQIHALIESSATTMPATPPALSIAPDGGVLWPSLPGSYDQVPTPRHSADGLLRCLPGFIIERTMLLANGQKEFLFLRS